MQAWEWFKKFAEYTPLALITANWEPLTKFFGALWDLLVALSVPAMDFLKLIFDWSPLGLIVKHWEPITAWLQSLWAKLKPIIEPIMKWFGGGEGGDGIIQTATNKVNAFTEAQQKRNAGAGGVLASFSSPTRRWPLSHGGRPITKPLASTTTDC